MIRDPGRAGAEGLNEKQARPARSHVAGPCGQDGSPMHALLTAPVLARIRTALRPLGVQRRALWPGEGGGNPMGSAAILTAPDVPWPQQRASPLAGAESSFMAFP